MRRRRRKSSGVNCPDASAGGIYNISAAKYLLALGARRLPGDKTNKSVPVIHRRNVLNRRRAINVNHESLMRLCT
jgi:hypothetical protein